MKVINSISYRIKYYQLNKNCQDLMLKINGRKDILTYFRCDEKNLPGTMTPSLETALQIVTLIGDSVPLMVEINCTELQLWILDFSVHIIEDCALVAQQDDVHPALEKEIIEVLQLVSGKISRGITYCELISMAKYMGYMFALLITA